MTDQPAPNLRNEAREAFLDLIADAREFSEDVDADCDEGHWTDLTTYTLVVTRDGLSEFARALGFDWCRYDGSAYEAIKKALADEVAKPFPDAANEVVF